MTKKRAPRGSGTITSNGYRAVFGTDVETGRRFVMLDHVRVAERALGRPLKYPEEVHHWNENKLDNSNENLVICPNRAYHMLLHQRTDAYDACGHADWLKCPYCRQYDEPANMKFRPRGRDRPGQVQWTHPQCARDYVNRKAHERRASHAS